MDAGNNRVLEFNTPLNPGSGETGAGDTTADRVFGQNGDFTKSATNRSTNPAAVDGIGPDSLDAARAATVDAQGNLYVGDTDNDRVLAFDQPLAPTPTPTATATATPTATPTPVNVTLKVKPKTLKLGTVAVGQSGNPKNVTVSNPKGSTKHPGLPVLIEMVEDSGRVPGDESLPNDSAQRAEVHDCGCVHSAECRRAARSAQNRRQRSRRTPDGQAQGQGQVSVVSRSRGGCSSGSAHRGYFSAGDIAESTAYAGGICARLISRPSAFWGGSSS